MSNSYFQFKQFTIHQDRCAMKVTTDSCLFGAWVARQINNEGFVINSLLDIGTGTGLLSLMLAQKKSFTDIDAIEIDKDSFEQAKENILASSWKNRINIFHADVRNFKFSNQYDVIISNPPFYENELKTDDPKKNVALHGNELTLDEVLRIINQNLALSGVFFLLLPYKRKDDIIKIFQKYKFRPYKIIFVRQSVKHNYFRIIIKGKKENGETSETPFDEISIWDEKQKYTPEFAELLKDFYLYL